MFTINPIDAMKNNPADLPNPIPHNSLVSKPIDSIVNEIHIAFEILAASCISRKGLSNLANEAPKKAYKGG